MLRELYKRNNDFRLELDFIFGGGEHDKEQMMTLDQRHKFDAYYTSQDLALITLRDLVVKRDSVFFDPCCGEGRLLRWAAMKCKGNHRLIGFDINEEAINIFNKNGGEGYVSDLRNWKFELKSHIKDFSNIIVMTGIPYKERFIKTIPISLISAFNQGVIIAPIDHDVVDFVMSNEVIFNDEFVVHKLPKSFIDDDYKIMSTYPQGYYYWRRV